MECLPWIEMERRVLAEERKGLLRIKAKAIGESVVTEEHDGWEASSRLPRSIKRVRERGPTAAVPWRGA
ncbi:hypothetical protein OsI_07105 [Oryza sativa Indica Group]|uniref:Uncharacterized protein n=2 Tax=Oryza TaxID=4527 RepID=B8AH71_ORYSI|nr:hypothetical protein OsI_07105 [Oryza sativa Indica Group]